MKRRRQCWRTAILAGIFLMLLASEVAALEAFQINEFDVRMDVGLDNGYDITETVDVGYSMQRHGIVRKIPLRTYNGRPVLVEDIHVEGHPFTTSEKNGFLSIRIGDSNRYAQPQEQYRISYRYIIGKDGIKTKDELYFNLIGTDWDCPIQNISFVINMPKDFDASGVNVTSGEKGSEDNTRADWSVYGRKIEGTLDSLGPGGALTVALPLPEGYFADAKTVKPVIPGEKISVGVSIAAILAGVLLWILLGKERRCFPAVQFYPPQGMNSADVGYLYDGKVDPMDVGSLIIDWANRGYLSITQVLQQQKRKTEKTFVFTKAAEPDQGMKDYEAHMFTQMFLRGSQGQVRPWQLSRTFYPVVENTQSRVQKRFTKDMAIFEKSNGLCQGLLLFLGWGSLAFGLWVAFHKFSEAGPLLAIVSYLALAAMIMALCCYVSSLVMGWNSPGKSRRHTLFMLVVQGVILGLLIFIAYREMVLLPVGGGLAVALWMSVWYHLCHRRTELGLKYKEYVLGFREFLKAAEQSRIQLLLEEDPGYFYHVLPYAMVLGVTDAWVKKFEAIAMAPPNWYASEGGGRDFYPGEFATDLVGGMTSLSSLMGLRPSDGSSSDSSSGGSAGGGSGGGGGSSW